MKKFIDYKFNDISLKDKLSYNAIFGDKRAGIAVTFKLPDIAGTFKVYSVDKSFNLQEIQEEDKNLMVSVDEDDTLSYTYFTDSSKEEIFYECFSRCKLQLRLGGKIHVIMKSDFNKYNSPSNVERSHSTVDEKNNCNIKNVSIDELNCIVFFSFRAAPPILVLSTQECTGFSCLHQDHEYGVIYNSLFDSKISVKNTKEIVTTDMKDIRMANPYDFSISYERFYEGDEIEILDSKSYRSRNSIGIEEECDNNHVSSYYNPSNWNGRPIPLSDLELQNNSEEYEFVNEEEDSEVIGNVKETIIEIIKSFEPVYIIPKDIVLSEEDDNTNICLYGSKRIVTDNELSYIFSTKVKIEQDEINLNDDMSISLYIHKLIDTNLYITYIILQYTDLSGNEEKCRYIMNDKNLVYVSTSESKIDDDDEYFSYCVRYDKNPTLNLRMDSAEVGFKHVATSNSIYHKYNWCRELSYSSPEVNISTITDFNKNKKKITKIESALFNADDDVIYLRSEFGCLYPWFAS